MTDTKYRIALLTVATGKYFDFAMSMIASARRFFLEDYVTTFFVFSDTLQESTDHCRFMYWPRLGWPLDTAMRSTAYLQYAESLSEFDYIYACDADMLFVSSVGNEIFGDLVATQHPGFTGEHKKPGSFEKRPESKAYVGDSDAQYYAGGFYGGKTSIVLQALEKTVEMMSRDLANGIFATWHDESYWNKYLVDNKPTLVLSPSYCYPENWKIAYDKKLLALDKNHLEIRQ